MFDTYEHKTTYVNRHVDVHEHRAPTDQSVKLLREMEQASRESVIKSIKLESNLVKGRLHMMRDYMSGHNKYATIIDINGKKLEVITSVDYDLSKEQQVMQIYRDISDRIAEEILTPHIKEVMCNAL